MQVLEIRPSLDSLLKLACFFFFLKSNVFFSPFFLEFCFIIFYGLLSIKLVVFVTRVTCFKGYYELTFIFFVFF